MYRLNLHKLKQCIKYTQIPFWTKNQKNSKLAGNLFQLKHWDRFSNYIHSNLKASRYLLLASQSTETKYDYDRPFFVCCPRTAVTFVEGGRKRQKSNLLLSLVSRCQWNNAALGSDLNAFILNSLSINCIVYMYVFVYVYHLRNEPVYTTASNPILSPCQRMWLKKIYIYGIENTNANMFNEISTICPFILPRSISSVFANKCG